MQSEPSREGPLPRATADERPGSVSPSGGERAPEPYPFALDIEEVAITRLGELVTFEPIGGSQRPLLESIAAVTGAIERVAE